MARVGRQLSETPLGLLARRRLRSQLEVRALDVELSRVTTGTELPRIAFLTDLHAGFFNTLSDLERLARKTAELEPDIVLLGGDLIDSHSDEIWLLGPALRRLDPPLGVYAVPGNHEYFHLEEFDDWTTFLEDNGVSVLINRGVRVTHAGTTLWIAGIDDWLEGRPNIYAALEGRRLDEPVVLLSHHPDAFVHAARADVDLQLSGHTHGGQVRFFGHAPMRHTSFGFLDGLYQQDRSQLYVSRGGGVTLLPIRFGAPPEIGLLRLVGIAPSSSVTPGMNPESTPVHLETTASLARAPSAKAVDAGARDRRPTGRSRRS